MTVAVLSAMFGLGALLCPPDAPGRWLALPGAFVLVEAVRARWPFGGVPLSTLAHSQAAAPLAPTVRLGGALLLIGLTAAGGVAVAAAVRRRWVAAAIPAGVVGVALALAALAPAGRATGTLEVALVQGGGPQGTRAEDTDERVVFERHVAASAALEPPLDLVVWPEDVVDIPGPVVKRPEGETLASLARRLGATLVAGVVEGAGPDRFRNAAVVFAPDGTVVDRFDKVHLVPFGEYVPFRSLLEPVAGDDLVPRDAIAGDGDAVVHSPVGPLGVVISWEVFFADRARDAIGNGGAVLLNPTNGASFRGILVQSQQIATSRLRSLETGRWTLQVAPTGFTAIVTPNGRVVDRSGVSERAIITGTVETRTGQTIATRVGDWVASALALAAVGGGWWRQRCGWVTAPAGSSPGPD